jgi:hypothetical protein
MTQEDAMDDDRTQAVPPASEESRAGAGKAPWQEPKLTFIEPTLMKHGRLEDVTAGFFGGFTP